MMLVCFKVCVLAVYSLAVYLFAHYLETSYSISTYYDWWFSPVHESNRIYDFIVVGAGSAGATVAAELHDADKTVLLVEAGSSPMSFFDIPILAPLLQQSPYDWQYKTVPQNNACKGLINNQSLWPQGKILGGSSRLNYMAYVPGHHNDFKYWFPDFAGFRLKEDETIISEPRWYTYLTDAILDAVSESSPKIKNDFRRVQLTMKNGERWSTDRLLQKRLKKGLHVLTNALVDKLIINDDIVKGVEFIKWGKKYKALAQNGVVVSAGAIGSPKLLMHSGIGPKQHLESLQINVINDLPVGENLVDHILTGIDLITLNQTAPLTIEDVLNPISGIVYFLNGEGPWTSAGIEAFGTLYTTSQNPENESPALQLMIIPVGIAQDDGIAIRKTMGISDEIFRKYFSQLTFRTSVTVAPVLLHPKSSGVVRLKSSNFLDDPEIDPKYLSHKDDVDILIKGIEFVKRLINTKALKKLGAELYKENFPGCEKFIFDSREYWECYIRHLTLTSYHPAGSCRIGRVVDESFRVYNMKNLYVVDASVLPELPSGNINAAVMTLARKAGKLLIHSHNQNIENNLKSCSKIAGVLSLFGVRTDVSYSQMN